MEKASKLTKKVFVSKNLNRAAGAALICHRAKETLGEIFDKGFCKNIEVISFKEGTLYIRTSNPAYSQEIKMRESEVVSTINKTFAKEAIEKIKFRGW